MIAKPRAAQALWTFLLVSSCAAGGEEPQGPAPGSPASAGGDTEQAPSEQATQASQNAAPRLAPRPAPGLVEDRNAPSTASEGDLLLGTVAGERLLGSELIAAWHALSSRDLWLVVDKLVATRLARAEAGRLGLVLPPELVTLELGRERERLKKEIEASAPGVPVEEFIAGRLGVDPAIYFEILGSATIERMLTERVARAWILAQESRAVRLIVVPKEDAESLEEELAAGADFEQVARERSLDDSSGRGGLVPYLVRTEASPLAQAAFEATQGEMVGPLVSGELRLFLRVEGVTPARPGNWAAVRSAVEESLVLQPLEDSEYVPWKLAMERSWPIDLQALGRLVGASR